MAEEVDKAITNLEHFKVVHCKNVHEKVRYNTNGTPEYVHVENDTIFKRLPLCEGREQNIGCAHTGANMKFVQNLDDLEGLLPGQKSIIESYKLKFNDLIFKIYALDHKRGNLEHDLAHSKMTADNPYDLERIKKGIKHLESEHLGLTKTLETLHKEILTNLRAYS